MGGLFPGKWVGPLAGGRYLGASGGWWTAGSRGKCGHAVESVAPAIHLAHWAPGGGLCLCCEGEGIYLTLDL